MSPGGIAGSADLASGFAHGHLVEMNDAETIARLK
jgi:hypothetical protein